MYWHLNTQNPDKRSFNATVYLSRKHLDNVGFQTFDFESEQFSYNVWYIIPGIFYSDILFDIQCFY